MADDTYPEEIYVDEIDVYDFDDDIWAELQELIEWESHLQENEHDAWFWGGPEA